MPAVAKAKGVNKSKLPKRPGSQSIDDADIADARALKLQARLDAVFDAIKAAGNWETTTEVPNSFHYVNKYFGASENTFILVRRFEFTCRIYVLTVWKSWFCHLECVSFLYCLNFTGEICLMSMVRANDSHFIVCFQSLIS